MAHPDHHAESSARKFGGQPSDYHAIHDWFDASKAHLASPLHRALRHHSAGIFEAERVFGRAIVNHDGRSVPVRYIGEQHVREDCRRIPSVADWLRHIPIEPWMVNGVLLPDIEPMGSDPDADWRVAVASGQTTLGLRDWLCQNAGRLSEAMDREERAGTSAGHYTPWRFLGHKRTKEEHFFVSENICFPTPLLAMRFRTQFQRKKYAEIPVGMV